MARNKKKIYTCSHCNEVIDGNPKHAIIRFDFPVFCTKEHLEEFINNEKVKK